MFNKNLKNIRLNRGISQKQVANYLNVSPQSVSKWEKGEALPSIEYLPRLAELLNCDINAFFAQAMTDAVDSEVLSKFLDLMNEAVIDETKTPDDIVAFICEHPSIAKETVEFCHSINEHKTLNVKTVMGILNCSDSEARTFIEHLLKGEMLEKLDIEDTYFVIKDNVKGFIILVEFNHTFYEKAIDKSTDVIESFKEKISINIHNKSR